MKKRLSMLLAAVAMLATGAASVRVLRGGVSDEPDSIDVFQD